MNCFRAWEDWAIYPQPYLIQLQNIFLGFAKAGEEETDTPEVSLSPRCRGDRCFVSPHQPEMLTNAIRQREFYAFVFLEEVSGEIDGAPLNRRLIDGLPMGKTPVDDIDGCPMGWDPLDGVPVDDIDGVPLNAPIDDIDGVPCESTV